MKRYSSVVVELSKEAVMLLVLWTVELFSGSMEGTQSCKDFTKTSHTKVVQTHDSEEARRHI